MAGPEKTELALSTLTSHSTFDVVRGCNIWSSRRSMVGRRLQLIGLSRRWPFDPSTSAMLSRPDPDPDSQAERLLSRVFFGRTSPRCGRRPARKADTQRRGVRRAATDFNSGAMLPARPHHLKLGGAFEDCIDFLPRSGREVARTDIRTPPRVDTVAVLTLLDA